MDTANRLRTYIKLILKHVKADLPVKVDLAKKEAAETKQGIKPVKEPQHKCKRKEKAPTKTVDKRLTIRHGQVLFDNRDLNVGAGAAVEIKRFGAYFKKLREGLLWGKYSDKALEAELTKVQNIKTVLDNVNLKPKDQWLKEEADRLERGIDEILSRTFSLHRVDDEEYRPFLKQAANDVNILLIQNRTTFEQHSNEYHKELTKNIKARIQLWQKKNEYREKSFKNKRLRNNKAEPPKKGWVWYDDSLLENGDPNWGFWGPPCKGMPTDPGLKLLPVEKGRKHYATGIQPKIVEDELHKYYLLLTIIHDWLLPSCVPIDKDISQNRLAKRVDIIDVNLEEEGKGIIERALEHVKADPARKKAEETKKKIEPQEKGVKSSGGKNKNKSIESKTTQPTTLKSFISIHCDLTARPDIQSKVTLLHEYNRKQKIKLPKLACKYRKGQHKYYYVDDLKKNWAKYQKEMPTLPPLKEQK